MGKLLVQFYVDCGRQGHLEGLFVTNRHELESAYGKYAYFGEVLGKHSEVAGDLEESEFNVVSEDQDLIDKLIDVMGWHNISGINPLDHIQDNEDDEEE